MSYDIFRIYTRELDDRKKCWIHKRERKITDGNIRNQDPFQWWQKQMTVVMLVKYVGEKKYVGEEFSVCW